MDALPLDPIDLVAVDPARNIHRRWSVVAMRDLFGSVVVETRWGRIGRTGRTLVRSFPDDVSALRYIAALQRLRGTAWRRIGAAYRSAQR